MAEDELMPVVVEEEEEEDPPATTKSSGRNTKLSMSNLGQKCRSNIQNARETLQANAKQLLQETRLPRLSKLPKLPTLHLPKALKESEPDFPVSQVDLKQILTVPISVEDSVGSNLALSSLQKHAIVWAEKNNETTTANKPLAPILLQSAQKSARIAAIHVGKEFAQLQQVLQDHVELFKVQKIPQTTKLDVAALSDIMVNLVDNMDLDQLREDLATKMHKTGDSIHQVIKTVDRDIREDIASKLQKTVKKIHKTADKIQLLAKKVDGEVRDRLPSAQPQVQVKEQLQLYQQRLLTLVQVWKDQLVVLLPSNNAKGSDDSFQVTNLQALLSLPLHFQDATGSSLALGTVFNLKNNNTSSRSNALIMEEEEEVVIVIVPNHQQTGSDGFCWKNETTTATTTSITTPTLQQQQGLWSKPTMLMTNERYLFLHWAERTIAVVIFALLAHVLWLIVRKPRWYRKWILDQAIDTDQHQSSTTITHPHQSPTSIVSYDDHHHRIVVTINDDSDDDPTPSLTNTQDAATLATLSSLAFTNADEASLPSPSRPPKTTDNTADWPEMYRRKEKECKVFEKALKEVSGEVQRLQQLEHHQQQHSSIMKKEAEEHLAKVQKLNQDLQQLVEGKDLQLLNFSTQVQQLTQDLTKRESQLSHVLSLYSDQKEEYEQFKQESTERNATELEEMEASLNESRKEYEVLTARFEEVTRELAEQREKESKLRTQLEIETARARDLNEEHMHLRSNLLDQMEERDTLQKQVNLQKTLHAKQGDRNRILLETNQTLSEMVEERQKRCNELEETAEDLARQLEKYQKRHGNEATRLEELRELRREKQAIAQQLLSSQTKHSHQEQSTLSKMASDLEEQRHLVTILRAEMESIRNGCSERLEEMRQRHHDEQAKKQAEIQRLKGELGQPLYLPSTTEMDVSVSDFLLDPLRLSVAEESVVGAVMNAKKEEEDNAAPGLDDVLSSEVSFLLGLSGANSHP